MDSAAVTAVSRMVAVSRGALDVRASEAFAGAADVVLTPIMPSEPIALSGEPAQLWLSLVGGRNLDTMTTDEQALVAEFEQYGIAGPAHHPHAVTGVDAPWLTSIFHEMVYALIAGVARDHAIDAVFIKGPMQHRQGLRQREHSGDVDVWVRPADREKLNRAMEPWGWTVVEGLFTGTVTAHSQTLVPGGWGCSIDVHTRFPGMAVADEQAFEYLMTQSEPWDFAGVQGLVPSVPASAVLRALHEVRPRPGYTPSQWKLEQASRALEVAGPEVVDVVRRFGAMWALSDSIRQSFPDAEFDFSEAKEPAEWSYLSSTTKTQAYVRAIRLVPLGQRLKLLARLVWPSSQTGIDYAVAHGYGDSNPTTARIRRIRDGIVEIFKRVFSKSR